MTTLLAVIAAVAGLASALSAGTLIKFGIERKDRKDMMKKQVEANTAAIKEMQEESKIIKAMCLGSLYDRTKYLGETYIKRGWITLSEYNDWFKYLYQPYHDAGGDGTVDKIAEEINKLPIEG